MSPVILPPINWAISGTPGIPISATGTERIITSDVSKAWPVPDAGLGAVTYVLEILTGIIGGRDRWRTMPWLVVLFGVMIVPLGAVSIFFIIIQPILIGTWCTLCLFAAAAMLIQIPYSVDELIATGQFLAERRRKGKSVILAFLRGDTMEGGRKMEAEDFEGSPWAIIQGYARWRRQSALVVGFQYGHRGLVDVHPADFRYPRRASEQRSFDRCPGYYDFDYGFGGIRASGAFCQYGACHSSDGRALDARRRKPWR